jgi:hypothetical protein
MITEYEVLDRLWSNKSVNSLSKVECDTLIKEIYDSIGACNSCRLRGEQECPMVSHHPDFGLVDESEYDGYCHKFMLKKG